MHACHTRAAAWWPCAQVRVWLMKRLASQLKPQLLSTVLQADRQLAALRATQQPASLPAAAAASAPAAALLQSKVSGRRSILQAFSNSTPGSVVAAAGAAPVAAALAKVAGPGAANGFSPPAVKARAARAAALGMLGFLQDARLQRHVEARWGELCKHAKCSSASADVI